MEKDHDERSGYVLRENPKRSWRRASRTSNGKANADSENQSESEGGALILMMLSRDMDCSNKNPADSMNKEGSEHAANLDSEHSDELKKSRYKCVTCNKVFNSYQALGGHRASHNADRNSGFKTAKRSKKMRKDHECPVCGKAFSSGQALGGHKRSHWAVNSEELHLQACKDEDENVQVLQRIGSV